MHVSGTAGRGRPWSLDCKSNIGVALHDLFWIRLRVVGWAFSLGDGILGIGDVLELKRSLLDVTLDGVGSPPANELDCL